MQRNARLQIDGNGFVEIGFGQIVDAASGGDAGIVDEYIDGPELALDRRHHRGHFGRLRNIRLHDHCATANSFYERCDGTVRRRHARSS